MPQVSATPALWCNTETLHQNAPTPQHPLRCDLHSTYIKATAMSGITLCICSMHMQMQMPMPVPRLQLLPAEARAL
jgi:hypothetical protein